jgi:hypothetical protein
VIARSGYATWEAGSGQATFSDFDDGFDEDGALPDDEESDPFDDEEEEDDEDAEDAPESDFAEEESDLAASPEPAEDEEPAGFLPESRLSVR